MQPTEPARTPPRPLLVVLRALGLGDLLTAVPALRALRRRYPRHHQVLLTPRWLAPLVSLGGAADEVVHADGLGPLPPWLRGAELAVNLHGSGPQSHALLLALRPGRLVAFADSTADADQVMPDWDPVEHEVRRWCRLVAACDAHANPTDLYIDVPLPDAPSSSLAGATLVHPGAKARSRRWPAQRWAAVARAEISAGRRVVVTAGDGEAQLAGEVAAGAGVPAADVRVGLDVARLAELASTVGRVVCGDTGIAHLATATRTPSVVLFGPTSPSTWGPPPGDPLHVALWAGRLGDPLADEVDPGLLAISVGDVLDAIADLPGRSVAPSGGVPA